MIKMFAIAGLAALVMACAAPSPDVANDPMRQSRGSTPSGTAKAADLGFHGPVYRGNSADGPN